MGRVGGRRVHAKPQRVALVARLMRNNGFLRSCRRSLFRAIARTRSFVRKDERPGIRREELKLLAQTIYLFAVIGTVSDGLLAIDFRSGLDLACGLLCTTVPVLYGVLVTQALRWRRTGDNERFLRGSLVSLAILGTTWGLLINLLASLASSGQRCLIDSLMIALVSTPMVAAPLAAAIAFWIPSAISGVAIVVTRYGAFDGYIIVCFFGYASFTLSAIVAFNKFLLERSIGRVILEQQNQTINLFLRDYEENASDWLWETDADLNLRHVSPRMAQVLRRPRILLDGSSLLGLVTTEDRSEGSLAIRRLFLERSPFRNLTLKVDVEGEARWWTMTGRPIFSDDALFRGYRGIGSDVTEARRSEERIRHLALYDSLTGLSNRQSFTDILHAACVQASETGRSGLPSRASRGDRLALHLLDLDRFKSVNDTFGHAVGDALLVAVAERLRGCTRAEAIIARLGGDEFGILSSVADANEAAALAQRVIDTLSQEYTLAGARQSIGVSIGVSFLDAGDVAPVDRMREADLALYAAKTAGRGMFRFFHPEMNADHHDRLTLQADLREAISSGGLSLLYQPIVDARTNKVVSIEALCRWVHPLLGPVSPSRFIPLAEEAGLIAALGEWTLSQACRVASGWPADVRVAVNVSPLQVRAGNLDAVVADALAASGLLAERLELELTEHAYLDATEQTRRAMQTLRENGSRLVLDDFGTGYSSLNYLTKFRFDGIKIDASFVQDLEANPAKAAVIRAIAHLAADMAIPITAEGVETAQQEHILRDFNVTNFQGYFIGHPVDAGCMTMLLADHARFAESDCGDDPRRILAHRR